MIEFTVTERINKRFDKYLEEQGDCLVWVGYRRPDGYGRINIKDKPIVVHRYAYQRWVGSIPGGLVVDHLCRNRACVNPRHLEVVTNTINILRGTGITAENVRKTHCPKGHSYSGSNLIINSNGFRDCRTCVRENERRYYHKTKAGKQ